MELFKVEAVIDGNTFEVSPKWVFEGKKGNLVYAKGYTSPKSGKPAMAVEQRLSGLIQNKKVSLESPDRIENEKLFCDVFYDGVNISSYFSAYKEQAEIEMKAEDTDNAEELSDDEEAESNHEEAEDIETKTE